MIAAKTRRRPGITLAAILFFAVFLNGFEAGGYQSILLSIGRTFQLDDTRQGLLASTQLTATMIAPLIFGPLADKLGKKPLYRAFLLTEAGGCALAAISHSPTLFMAAVFAIGCGISVLQYLSIAVLAESYPLTGKQKVGILASLYSLGAVLGPMVCGLGMSRGVSWRGLFLLLLCALLLDFAVIFPMDFSPRELLPSAGAESGGASGKWVLSGVILLCLALFVYTGFENGFAFFINSFVSNELHGSHAYLSLSLFWMAMIPSRLLCGFWHRYSRQLLVAAVVGMAVFAALVAAAQSPWAAILLSFPLGFFSGAVYPTVMNRSLDFSGSRTGTVTGLLTAVSGLGGAVTASAVGVVSQSFGLRTALATLAVLMLANIALSLILLRKKETAS